VGLPARAPLGGITYHANGMIARVAHANGVNDVWQKWQNDPHGKPWPAQITSTGVVGDLNWDSREYGDSQPRRRRGPPDEADDDGQTDQRLSTPVGGDVREHPVFDLVPLAAAGWEMANGDRHPCPGGERLPRAPGNHGPRQGSN
jgi:hypothetical protein